MYVIALRHDAVLRNAGSYDSNPAPSASLICPSPVAWIAPSTIGSVYSAPVRLSTTVRLSALTRGLLGQGPALRLSQRVPSLIRHQPSPGPASAAARGSRAGRRILPSTTPRKRRDVGDGDPLRRRLSLLLTLAQPAAGYQSPGERRHATRMLSGRPATACNIAAALPFEIATDMFR